MRGGRPIRVVVRLTPGEYRVLAARAQDAGLTVPSYLALTGSRPDGVAAADARSALTNIAGVRRVLAGVAGNLNQLTRKLHGTGEIDVTLPAVLATVEELTPAVADAVGRVAAVVTGGSR